jgi:flagellar assembly factor FliW
MLFDLKAPLLGFESIRQMELQKIDEIFMRLKTPDADEPSFTLINPFVLRDYAFEIPTPLQRAMEITDDSNLLIFNIIVIQTPIENSVVNFIAPLVFNTDNHTMAQVILDNSGDYGIAEPIANYLEAKEEKQNA